MPGRTLDDDDIDFIRHLRRTALDHAQTLNDTPALSGDNTIAGSFIVGDPAGAHVVVGTDANGADGVRLYSSDGTTVLIDLNISSLPAQIIGALIKTAVSGPRWEITSAASDTMSGYTAAGHESLPGGFHLVGAANPLLQVYAPTYVAGATQSETLMNMRGRAFGVPGGASIDMISDLLTFNGSGVVTGTTSASPVIAYGTRTGTTTALGKLTGLAHSLGTTPAVVLVTATTGVGWQFRVDNLGPTTFDLTARDNTGVLLNAQSTGVFYLAVA